MKVFENVYAEAYDSLYKTKAYVKECDFIESVILKYKRNAKKILDLGCGTGGHDIILAERGYKVTGVDLSSEMLKIAEKKSAEKKLKINFVKKNIAEINIGKKFDAVISMFAVMGYQTENYMIADVCQRVREHLSKGGLFIFDCWYGPAVLSDKPKPVSKEIKSADGEKIVRFTTPVLDAMRHTVDIQFKLRKIKKDKLVDETKETHKMRFMFPQEIKYFLNVAGFEVLKLCPFMKMNKELTIKDWDMTVIAKAV
ncbi:class I SAM-dependent methyltransferase [bacterium]|nr:class I SAM-dependent methyltransferase [bacterium]